VIFSIFIISQHTKSIFMRTDKNQDISEYLVNEIDFETLLEQYLVRLLE